MSTATEPRVSTTAEGERRFILYNVGWQGYQTLLRLFEENGPRLTYDRGNVELMAPVILHERPKKLLAYIVEAITDELEIRRVGAGSTTYSSEILERGVEPDDCFYLANAHRLRQYPKGYHMDPTVDPVPDLAIEIEITVSILDKIAIYAALGLPEIWRHDGRTLRVVLLQPDGTYAESDVSASFPFVALADVRRLLEENDGTDDTRWGRSVRAWVRDVVAPNYARPA